MLRTLALTITLLAGSATSALASSLPEVSDYLQGITTLETRFIQHNADGSQSHGTLYMRRPGRMRMEYDAGPNGGLLIVGGGTVAIFDQKSRGAPQQYPLSRTPLAPLLSKSVDLSRSEMFEDVSSAKDRISVLVRDPGRSEQGQALLTFEHDPLRLTSWTLTNEFGEETRVDFEGDVQTGHPLSSFLFNIVHEQNRRDR